MSIEKQNDGNMTDNIEKAEQKSEKPPLHLVARIFLWAFIIINAYIIVFGLIPAIFSIPILRHLAIPTPWFFHAGYGTPLGLSLGPAIVMAVACSLLLALSVSFLKRSTKSSWRDFCSGLFLLALVCTIIMINISESPEDYVRGALLREGPEGVTVETAGWEARNDSEALTRVRIRATSDYVPVEKFEAFVLEMQTLTFQVLYRRNVNNFFLDIRHDTQIEGENKSLLWEARTQNIYTSERLYTDSEYGFLLLLGWAGNLREWDNSVSVGRNALPATSIQETINAVVLADNFARNSIDEMPNNTEVGVARFWDDESEPPIDGILYGKVNIEVSHSFRSFPIGIDEIEESFVEISTHVRFVVENHDIEIHRLLISLRPDGLEDVVVWRSWGREYYGTLHIGSFISPIHEFEDIHITEIQGLIDSLGY